MVYDQTTTPTHLPSPPRRVHGGFNLGLWVMRLFILPHMCIGVCLVGMVILTVLVAVFGTDLQARVKKAYTSTGSKRGTVYRVEYVYQGGSHEYTNSGTVSATTYASLTHPAEVDGGVSTVKVRYLGVGPVHYDLVPQESTSPWATAGGLLFGAMFWNGILSIFVYLVWIAPIRNRLLVRYGQATKGTLLSTRVSRGKSTSYYAKFRFTDPSSGKEITREIMLPGRAQYTSAHAHQPVTVVYDPRRPKRALIYELSGFRVEGAAPV